MQPTSIHRRRTAPTSSDPPPLLRNVHASLHVQLAQANRRIDALTAALETPPADAAPVAARIAALASLTAAEQAVLRLFVVLPYDKAIAAHSGKRVQTVRNQIASILKKLDVHSREELLVLILTGNKPCRSWLK